MPALQGSCQCGSVRFTLAEQPTAASACHCVQCRKQSGHYFASANLPKTAVSLIGAANITWYQTSQKVKRGFLPQMRLLALLGTCVPRLDVGRLGQSTALPKSTWSVTPSWLRRATTTRSPMVCHRTSGSLGSNARQHRRACRTRHFCRNAGNSSTGPQPWHTLKT